MLFHFPGPCQSPNSILVISLACASTDNFTELCDLDIGLFMDEEEATNTIFCIDLTKFCLNLSLQRYK